MYLKPAIDKAIVKNLVNTVSNIVTTTLFPVEDLFHTLDIGHTNLSLQTLHA